MENNYGDWECFNMTFNAGDRVIHALYGTGIIEEYKKIKVDNEEHGFYVISIKSEKLSLMVPEKDILAGKTVRKPSSPEKAEEALKVLKKKAHAISESGVDIFFKEYSEKLKSGDIISLAEVVRDFSKADLNMEIDKESKKFLQRAKKILIQELSIALNKKEYEVTRDINKIFKSPPVKKKQK